MFSMLLAAASIDKAITVKEKNMDGDLEKL